MSVTGRAYAKLAGPNRFGRTEVVLMLSLMLIAFVPTFNDIFVSRIAYGQGVINIIGQIEWFDTINEAALAFLVLPMYNLFNSVRNDRDRLKNRISQSVTLGLAIYVTFSIAVLIYASHLANVMSAPANSVIYLRLMTVGFIFDYLVQISLVVLVVLGKSKFVTILMLVKIAVLTVSNIVLMSFYSYVGAGAAVILSNIVMVIVCAFLLHKERLIQPIPNFEKSTLKQWIRVGKFSGGEIFLNNLIYILIVCKMINVVMESGNYWVANNFIWGWLLIPVHALGEIVRRDYEKGQGRMRAYAFVLGFIMLIWLASVPAWEFIYGSLFGVTDPEVVLNITYKLMPFYLAYGITAVIDSVFLSVGRTEYTFSIALIVNIVYYGSVYLFFNASMIDPSLDFIIMLFGFGMVIHMMFSVLFFLRYRRKNVKAIGLENHGMY